MNKIIQFIQKFNKSKDIQTLFTCGCCYWFAYILCERFAEAKIMYDPIANHFVAGIKNRLYDITGDVTDKYKVQEWNSFSDEAERQRIIDYCIEFTKD